MRTSLERDLLELALDGASDSSVVAIGECGLDFLREKDFNCPRHSQFGIWEMHFSLANAANLPMFIHSRESESETLTFLKSHFLKRGGVVHSFDGGYEYAREILTFSDNLYIGINGCSLKTVENLETVKRLPLERLLIESDAPWCGIKGVSAGKALLDASFAREEEGMEEVNKPEKLKGKESLLRTVKSRNEPMNTRDVLQVLALLHPEQDLATISAQIVKNTQKLFGV
jgi:TatD DNase family protein